MGIALLYYPYIATIVAAYLHFLGEWLLIYISFLPDHICLEIVKGVGDIPILRIQPTHEFNTNNFGAYRN